MDDVGGHRCCDPRSQPSVTASVALRRYHVNSGSSQQHNDRLLLVANRHPVSNRPAIRDHRPSNDSKTTEVV